MNSDALYTSYVYQSYPSVASDKDLIADGGGLCRWIYVGCAGDIVLEREDGTDVTMSVVSGANLVCAARTIRAATTATCITVFW